MSNVATDSGSDGRRAFSWGVAAAAAVLAIVCGFVGKLALSRVGGENLFLEGGPWMYAVIGGSFVGIAATAIAGGLAAGGWRIPTALLLIGPLLPLFGGVVGARLGFSQILDAVRAAAPDQVLDMLGASFAVALVPLGAALVLAVPLFVAATISALLTVLRGLFAAPRGGEREGLAGEVAAVALLLLVTTAYAGLFFDIRNVASAMSALSTLGFGEAAAFTGAIATAAAKNAQRITGFALAGVLVVGIVALALVGFRAVISGALRRVPHIMAALLVAAVPLWAVKAARDAPLQLVGQLVAEDPEIAEVAAKVNLAVSPERPVHIADLDERLQRLQNGDAPRCSREETAVVMATLRDGRLTAEGIDVAVSDLVADAAKQRSLQQLIPRARARELLIAADAESSALDLILVASVIPLDVATYLLAETRSISLPPPAGTVSPTSRVYIEVFTLEHVERLGRWPPNMVRLSEGKRVFSSSGTDEREVGEHALREVISGEGVSELVLAADETVTVAELLGEIDLLERVATRAEVWLGAIGEEPDTLRVDGKMEGPYDLPLSVELDLEPR